MAIIVNSVNIITDATVEPITLAEAKEWMRISYDTDDVIIAELIIGARKHLELLCGVSFVTKVIKSNIELTGSVPNVWMVDVPYSPLIAVNELKWKTGFNMYETLVANDDYEIIGGKIWLYSYGNYIITYQAGYTITPQDIINDMLTLISWTYQNRGKNFKSDQNASAFKEYPTWSGLNYNQYKKVVI